VKLEWRLARSRVGRRVVALFVLGTLVPLAAVAILCYWQVRAVLIDRGYWSLAQLTSAYSSALNERLVGASVELRALAGEMAGDLPRAPARDERWIRERFAALGVALPDGRVLTRLGPVPPVPAFGKAELAQLGAGESVLRTSIRAGTRPAVLLATATAPGRPEAGIAFAVLEPAFLWGEADDLPALTDFTVADQAGRPLFSSLDDADDAMRAMRAASPPAAHGKLAFRHRDDTQIAYFREIFLQPHFLVHAWTIYASRPQSELLAPLRQFVAVFIPVVGLALFGVALLSVAQIRRTLVPLERLIEGTRRVARREFSTPVIVDADDEFGELAASFNAMSARLESQFAVLSTLADIDRAILSRPDIGHVIETILLRVRRMVPSCDTCIAVLGTHDPGMATVFTRGAAAEATTVLAQIPFPPAEAAGIGAVRQGAWLADDTLPAFARPLRDLGAAAVFALPIAWQDTVVAIMSLGVRDRTALSDEMQADARNLADRVGVAFAAAAREEQLYYQAHYDALTGLPNRLYFKDQLAITLAHAHRSRRSFALLYIDLDHFKGVNDGLGHAAGDEVLRQAAARLRACVREADTVARLGGDEFAVVLPEIASNRDPQAVADHAIAALAQPFAAAGQELFLNASIGIALYPDDGATPEDLLRNADAAMYRAKDAGRGRSAYFEEEMNVAALARVRTERDLRHAIERREFVVHYQPIVDAATGRAIGVEALVRWNHHERGLLAPTHFVDLAEQIGVVDAMGDWVLREACERFRAWRDAGLELDRLAVNASPRQFRQPDFAAKIARTLAESGLPAGALEIEITESLLLDATANVEASIAALKEIGVQIALDDFGTGYSSLAYLRRFPVDVVKIDGSFVKDLPADASSAAIVRAIVSMSHALGKKVVAEGVTGAKQAAFLAASGCDRLQGFHLCEPMASPQVEAYLRRSREVAPLRRVHAL
jgi:diguanylate cyclase (GGDEF)-like protein